MEPTRVTVDEVKERMGRGEQFAFIDTRNPKAWGESDAKLPGRSVFLPTRWSSTWTKFRGIASSSPTALHRTKHQAPVWRKH